MAQPRHGEDLSAWPSGKDFGRLMFLKDVNDIKHLIEYLLPRPFLCLKGSKVQKALNFYGQTNTFVDKHQLVVLPIDDQTLFFRHEVL